VLFQPFTERDVRFAVDRLSHLLAEHGFAVKDLRIERPGARRLCRRCCRQLEPLGLFEGLEDGRLGRLQ
jgi:hypothetical protein